MEDLQLLAVALGEDGDLDLAYMKVPQDVRKNGLVWQRSVHVPRGSDYDDEIEAVIEALFVLLRDVLDDEDRAEPIDPEEEEDEDDE